jgi:hypothetical protein
MEELDTDVLTEDVSQKPCDETDVDDVRLQRIIEYLQDSLADSDPLDANLGTVNADLFLMAHRLMQGMGDVLASRPDSLEEFDLVHQSLDHYLRVTKQIDRFTQLLERRKRAQKEDKSPGISEHRPPQQTVS